MLGFCTKITVTVSRTAHLSVLQVLLTQVLVALQSTIQYVEWMVEHIAAGVTQISSKYQISYQINAVRPKFNVRENVHVAQKMSYLLYVVLMVRHT